MSNSSISSNEVCQQFFDSQKQALIEHRLGYQIKPLTIKLFMGIIYTLVLCSGVIGNVATCTVIARKRFMHTRTNCYLFSLAVSDLLLLLCGLPFEFCDIVYRSYPWVLGTHFCRIRVFLTEISPLVSIMILTIFSVERYLCICHPFRPRTRWIGCTKTHNNTTHNPTVHTYSIPTTTKPKIPSSSSNKISHNNNFKTIHNSHATGDDFQRPENQSSNNSTTIIEKSTPREQSFKKRKARERNKLPKFSQPVIIRETSLKSCGILIVSMWSLAALCATPISGLSEAFAFLELPSWTEYVNQTEAMETCPSGSSCDLENRTSSINWPNGARCEDHVDELWPSGKLLLESTVCAPSSNSPWAQYFSPSTVILLSTFVFFVAPMLIMTIMYSRIAVKLRRSNLRALLAHTTSSSSGNSGDVGKYTIQEQRAINSRKGVTRMLVAVVVAFFICWAPFHLQRVLPVSGVITKLYMAEYLYYLSGTLYYVSATVNPILYSLMSARFRRAFRAVFCRDKPSPRHARIAHGINLQMCTVTYLQRNLQTTATNHNENIKEESVAPNKIVNPL